jgi:ATP-dependent DNA helicase RecG
MSEMPFFDPLLEPPPLPQVDRLPVRNATEDMIDLDKVAAHIKRAVELQRIDPDAPREPLPYLVHQECMAVVDDTTYPTLAGLLCFGRDPQALLRWAVVDLAHYRGVQAISYELVHLGKNVGGTIFDQLEYLRRYLWTYTQHGMTIADGFQRVDLHEYPEVVIRELGVNMLSHRDYTKPNAQARVMLFRNRIEWSNPGGLPEGVTPENILRKQHSRNPVIQSILYEAGYVEALGQGLDTVVAVLQREGLANGNNPSFEDLGDTFIVTIHGRSHDEFYTDGVFANLNKHQRKIFQLIQQKGEVSTPEVMQKLDRSESAVLRDLRALMAAGLVEASGGARLRRYRLAGPLASATSQ